MQLIVCTCKDCPIHSVGVSEVDYPAGIQHATFVCAGCAKHGVKAEEKVVVKDTFTEKPKKFFVGDKE